MIDFSGHKFDDASETFVLELTGRLDSNASEFLLDCIQGYIDSGEHKFVLDCRDLDYISSMGLATLVRANSRLKQRGGSIAISGVKGIVAEALRLVRFDRMFHMFPTVSEAVVGLQSQSDAD